VHLLTSVSPSHRWILASYICEITYTFSFLSFTLTSDDCVFTGSSVELIATYNEKFNARYTLTDLGPISCLLGIKITRTREDRTISLSQTTYLNSMSEWFALTDTKPYRTPMVPGIVYSQDNSPSTPDEADRMKKVPYRLPRGYSQPDVCLRRNTT